MFLETPEKGSLGTCGRSPLAHRARCRCILPGGPSLYKVGASNKFCITFFFPGVLCSITFYLVLFLLCQPAEKYPEIFSQDSLFGRYKFCSFLSSIFLSYSVFIFNFVGTTFCRFPYFLPCLCISLFAVCVLIGSLWLPVSYPNLLFYLVLLRE